MTRLEKTIQLLLDNDVFVSAIHTPQRETQSLKLILEIIKSPNIQLVGNQYLLEEMTRYSEVFPSSTALLLLRALANKTQIVPVQERYVKLCAPFFDSDSFVDIIHAATCLQTDSILVSNDKHFHNICMEEIIPVWTIQDAIEKMLT